MTATMMHVEGMQEHAGMVLCSAVKTSPEDACMAILSAESFRKEVDRYVGMVWSTWLIYEIGFFFGSHARVCLVNQLTIEGVISIFNMMVVVEWGR